ncbi:hypothetical protein EV363DRAFT_1163220 [Boletus edulis]|nr:hypothetical protein EV363DRAFT_1163220 [Boletus edulis]
MTCRAPAYKLSKGNLTISQKYLQAGVGTLLILEQSFYLSQQGDPDAVSSAAQEYRTLDIPAQVNIALRDVFTHFGTTSKEEKVAMICNIITQNHMGKLIICINIPLINLGTLLQRGQWLECQTRVWRSHLESKVLLEILWNVCISSDCLCMVNCTVFLAW